MNGKYNSAIGICGIIGIFILMILNFIEYCGISTFGAFGIFLKYSAVFSAQILMLVSFILLKKSRQSKVSSILGIIAESLFLSCSCLMLCLDILFNFYNPFSYFNWIYVINFAMRLLCGIAYYLLGIALINLPAFAGKGIKIAAGIFAFLSSITYITAIIGWGENSSAILYRLWMPMSLTGSLLMMLCFLSFYSRRYLSGWFTVSGRARRKEYWAKYVTLRLMIVLLVLPVCITEICRHWFGGSPFISYYAFIFLFLSYLDVPVMIRRLHDRNLSGWFALLFIFLFFVPFVSFVAAVFQFVIVGCLPGTKGSNKYGADPKAMETDEEIRVGTNLPEKESESRADLEYGDAGDATKRLKTLQHLYKQGLISAIEYEAKRKEIVATL